MSPGIFAILSGRSGICFSPQQSYSPVKIMIAMLLKFLSGQILTSLEEGCYEGRIVSTTTSFPEIYR